VIVIDDYERGDAVCSRCLDTVAAQTLDIVVGLETGDEWWCEHCLDGVSPVPVDCAACTVRFDSADQHIGGRWIAEFYDDGTDAYLCEWCCGEHPELLIS
jgi:hypothetical protein